MKKYSITILLLILFCSLKAQTNNAKKDALKVGDKVPDITINNIINSKITSAKISDFKGKLLLLDFWATWCSPCVAMIPKMEQLQQEFNSQIQFLPVAYQPETVIAPFLEKRNKLSKGTLLPEVTGDQVLAKMFPHTYLPHYVWISPDGTVKAITGFEEVTSSNIREMLNSTSVKLTQKIDEEQLTYDKSLPLFINNNGGNGQALVYHSLFSNYTPGLAAGFSMSRDSIKGNRLSCRNLPIITLYRIANWDKDWFDGNRTVLQIKDTTKIISDLSGAPYIEWMSQGNAFSYELSIPSNLNGKESEYMRADLDRLIPQYEGLVEKRNIKCFALVRTSSQDKIHTSGGQAVADFNPEGFHIKNSSIWALVQRLNQVYLRGSNLSLVDATGYPSAIDLNVEADLTNPMAINDQLKKYDLAIKETNMDVDMLIIRDRPSTTSVKPVKQSK